MLKAVETILEELWGTVAEMSPYLLFGFAVAGLLSAFLSPSLVRRHLAGRGLWPIFKASLFGVPLPLCSCSVIPVAMSLANSGAGRAPVVAFLLSTPQTGVDSFLVTLGILGPVFAAVRPVMAFVTGLVGGILTDLWDTHARAVEAPVSCGCQGKEGQQEVPSRNRWVSALEYGFWTLPRDIGRPLLVGIAVAAAISMAVPDSFFSKNLGTGIWPMLAMMAVGIPMYVCATASVPVAAAMILKGLSPGAALVFLMTGPATNAAGLVTIWKALGKRAALAYLVAAAVCALASGLVLDWAIEKIDLPVGHAAHWMPNSLVQNLSGVILMGLIVATWVGRAKTRSL